MSLRAFRKWHVPAPFGPVSVPPAASEAGSAGASVPSPASRREIRWWIWGFPLAFVVHDGEEALSIVLHGGYQEGENAAGHLVAGAMATGYVMGVVTALPACVAHGGLTLTRFQRAGLLPGRRVIGSGAFGVVIAMAAVELAHVYGRLVS